jgi:Fe-S cluster assembly ATP-binding protein
MLTIKNTSAVIDAIELLNDISITINPGEIHAIIGPSRSGKSSLAHLIAGHPLLIQTEGSIIFNKKNISKLDAEDRAALGIYTTFQNPPEILGLTNFKLVKMLLKAKKDTRLDQSIEEDYSKLCELFEMSKNHGDTDIDYDSVTPSEFKKNEIILMMMLNPKLAIIDEIDSELDDDDLDIVGAALKNFVNNKKAMLLITNNKTLLDMISPTHLHVIVKGVIKKQDDATLYKRIIEDGYSQFS